MPLAALGNLLSFAAKIEIEQQLRPLWIAHYAISKITGTETMQYEDMLSGVYKNDSGKNDRTGEEILKDFSDIIAADKAKGG